MYSTILVPLDGTKEAEAILLYVANTARRYGANVFLLKIEKEPLLLEWDEVVDFESCQAEFKRRSEQALSYLSIQREEFCRKGVEAYTEVAYGPVVRTILNVAEDIHADLIAMSSHGLNGLSRRKDKSVTAAVFERADRPFLLIRSDGNT